VAVKPERSLTPVPKKEARTVAPIVDLRPPRAARLPRIIALAVATAGLITVLDAIFAPARGKLDILTDSIPLTVRSSATSVAVLAGLGLLVIAGGLARRQRHAWWIALALLTIVGFSHVVRNLDVLLAGVSFGMVIVLVWARDEFDARPGPASMRRAILMLPVLAMIVWMLGWVAIMANADSFSPHPTPGDAAIAALRGAVGFPLGLHTNGSAEWIPGVLPLLGVAVVIIAFTMAFRPVVERSRSTEADPEAPRRLVKRWGSDSLAYFSLRADKEHFVVGESMVSYRYLWNLGLVSGDPVGDPQQAPAAIAAFVKHARSLGWGVAVLAAGADLAPTYSRLGLKAFYLGDEAVIDLATFSLEGRPIRKVRQSCHRLEREGYTLEFLSDCEIPPDTSDALEAVAHAWRGRAPERGFTMALGRGPSPEDEDCLTVVARDSTKRVQGYLHLVPIYGDDPGFSLDQMRRKPETPNGLTEWMVARAAEELGSRGYSRLSLNFSFLGGLLSGETDLSLVQRGEVAFVRRLNPYFQIDSLRTFNGKFFPEWIPRYVYYEAPLSLPRVALAYLEAEAFLRVPLIGTEGRLRKRHESQTKTQTA
jgi:lysylphosphatidylglycerol synthetase-like protein (DUF2156 family)